MYTLKYSEKNKNVSIPILGRHYKPNDKILVTDKNKKEIEASLAKGWTLEKIKEEVKKDDM